VEGSASGPQRARGLEPRRDRPAAARALCLWRTDDRAGRFLQPGDAGGEVRHSVPGARLHGGSAWS
jgi:hypothetical protein